MTSPAVAISGYGVCTAFGRGAGDLLDAAWTGRPAFGPVGRFDVAGCRVPVAATAPGLGGGPDDLRAELVAAITTAAAEAGLSAGELAGTPLILAVHGDPALARASDDDREAHRASWYAAGVAAAAGTGAVLRTYTSACVAASTAVAAAAAMISRSEAAIERIVVAAGYLVEPDQFAIFDAGRVFATDGSVRPFSAGRTGLLLGDGVAAVVLESPAALRRRGREPLARLRGWARTGDAYHVCRARPDGAGVSRAIGAALTRGGLRPGDVGYVNAHGSGARLGDRAEANALTDAGVRAPVSSTKSVHGQALEASGLVELVITVESLRHGRFPVNAGYLGRDDDCPLDVVDAPRTGAPQYALSLNSGFGGANTALLVAA